MADLNQITFSGRLGGDAEVKKMGDRDKLSFRVAVNAEYSKDAAPVWYSCLAFYSDKRAFMLDELKKGTQVMVTGSLRVREVGDKTYLNVDADNFTWAKSAKGGAAPAAAGELDDEIPF